MNGNERTNSRICNTRNGSQKTGRPHDPIKNKYINDMSHKQ